MIIGKLADIICRDDCNGSLMINTLLAMEHIFKIIPASQLTNNLLFQMNENLKLILFSNEENAIQD